MNYKIIPFIFLAISLCFACYRLGFTQASINVYDYDNKEVSSSIQLACTAMIERKSVKEVQSNIQAYNFIRDVEKGYYFCK